MIFNVIWITITIIFGGEPAVISLSFAAAMAKVSLITVIAAGYLTVVVGDIFWFIVVREISPGKVRKWKFIKKSYDAYSKTINKIEKNKPFKLLFWARSFYGGGWGAIIYLAGTTISLGRLILYSAVVNTFWVAVSVVLGWEAGKGFGYALQLFLDIRIAITILVVAAIVIYFAIYLLKKILHKK